MKINHECTYPKFGYKFQLKQSNFCKCKIILTVALYHTYQTCYGQFKTVYLQLSSSLCFPRS